MYNYNNLKRNNKLSKDINNSLLTNNGQCKEILEN
jgi:hypothetical protein